MKSYINRGKSTNNQRYGSAAFNKERNHFANMIGGGVFGVSGSAFGSSISDYQ